MRMFFRVLFLVTALSRVAAAQGVIGARPSSKNNVTHSKIVLSINNTIYVDGKVYPITSTGLSKALTAASVLSPTGTVVLSQMVTTSSTITIPSGVTLLCMKKGGVKQANGANLQLMISMQSGTNMNLSGCTIDGNRANNLGPYRVGEALLWIGDGGTAGATQYINVNFNAFLNCPRLCAFINSSYHVSFNDNFGSNVGGELIHVDNSNISSPATNSVIRILNNQTDFSQRAFVGTATFTNGQTSMTGMGFSTTWGTDGYDSIVTAQGQLSGNPILSCSSSSSCTLTRKFRGTSGTYPVAVGNDFGIQVIGAAGVQVVGNTLKGVDGGLEAIQFSATPNDSINFSRIENNVVRFPVPRSVGSEGISFSNLYGGGSGNRSKIVNNVVVGAATTGISYVPVNFTTGTFDAGLIRGNKIVDANATATPSPAGFDSGIRVGGANVSSTVVSSNVCRSTRTGLSPAREGFNYCVAVDGTGNAAVATLIGGNRFDAADTSGTFGIVRDNGSGTQRVNLNAEANTIPKGELTHIGCVCAAGNCARARQGLDSDVAIHPELFDLTAYLSKDASCSSDKR